MAFNLDNYEPVADRITRFYSEHPDGRILTEIVPASEGQWIVRATIYRDANPEPCASGYAQEHVTQKGVNSTSALENCETSAIGRALANLGYGAKGAARPSREEMAKTQAPSGPPPADKARIDRLVGEARLAGINEWVKDQGFDWPWSEQVCDVIQHKLDHLAQTGELPDAQPELVPVGAPTKDTADLAGYSEEPF